MKTVLITIFASLLLSSAALAENQSYESVVTNEIQTAMQLAEDLTNEKDQGAAWDLFLIRFKVNASVGVQVPFLAKFAINPFVELFFLR